MFVMTLPPSPNRLWLLSFWFAISLLVGLIAGALSWMLASPLWSGLGVLVALSLATSGLLRLQKLSTPYKAWNNLANRFARFAQAWVGRVCFYTVFVAVGRAGTSLGLAHPGADTKSLWVSRETLAPSEYAYPHKSSTAGPIRQSWISAYLSWAAGSRNLWACSLLPFLILLRALDTGDESHFPSNIYTLY